MIRTGSLAGRVREQAILRGALEEALGGRTIAVLITGEAGIGKTRLVEQLADEAASTDARVAWGRGWDEGGAPAFWPWRTALRSLGVTLDTDSLADGPTPSELASPGMSAASQDGGARFRLFEAVRDALTGAASRTPLVVIIEDLHAADAASLELFRFIARDPLRSPLLLVGTSREEVPEERAAAHRDLDACTTRIQLRGLDEAGVTELLRELPHADSLPRPDQILDRTGGNPLFVAQIAQLPPEEILVAVPASAREAIDRRLNSLDDRTAHVLRVASVLGRRFEVAALANLAAVAPAEARVMLRSAEAIRLVVPEPDGFWAFVHDLVREAVLASWPPRQALEVHRGAAKFLDSVGAHPSEIAQHAWLGGAPDAADRCVRAGDEAFDSLGYEDAAEWFRRALETAPTEPRARIAILIRLATALHRVGEFAARRMHALEAARLARELNDGTTFAQAAVLAAGYSDTRHDPERTAVLEEALAGLDGTDSPLRARVMGELAQNLVIGSRTGGPDRAEEGLELAVEAVAAARRSGDQAVLGWALYGRHYALMRDETVLDERERLARELVEVASASGDSDLECIGHLWLAHDRLVAGSPAEFEELLRRASQLAARNRQPFTTWTTVFPAAGIALLRGRPDEGERLADEALAAGARTGFHDVFAVDANLRYYIARARHEVVPWFESLGFSLDAPPQETTLNPEITAIVLSAAGRLDEARAALRGLDEDFGTLAAACHRAVAHWHARDPSRAEALYGRLLPFRHLWSTALILVSANGPVELSLGQLACLLGRPDDAREHLAAARTQAEAFGAAGLVQMIDEAEATLHGVTPAAACTRVERSASLTREGGDWEFEFEGRRFRVRDTVGQGYLARLLSRPGREMHCVDLATSGAGAAVEGSPGAGLDDEAKAAYRRRVEELKADIDEAAAANDSGRVEKLEQELDFLLHELRVAVGLGGRDRKTGSTEERARLSVTRALKRALERIEQTDAALGRHLSATVRTGAYCVYQPDPAAPLEWDIRV